MDFKDISFKMFKSNINKYKLFILCNIFAIAVFYSLIAILENEQFMDPRIINSMITSSIYAPIVVMLGFNTMFLPYTQNIFIKSRQKDYGILLSLGLSEKEMISSVFIEDCIMCVVSLILGIILGTFLNLFFIGFTKYIIRIEEINISFSKKSYVVVGIYVFSVYMISLIINLCKIIKTTVTEKLKLAVKLEYSKHYSLWLIYLGIALNIINIYILKVLYKGRSNVFIISLAVAVFGSILIFFNGEAVIDYLKRKNYKSYIKNIFLISDIKYYYGKNKKTFFATSWIFFTMLFFLILGSICNPNLLKNHLSYNKFDISTFHNEGGYEPIEEDEIKEICNSENNPVEEHFDVKFVRNGAFTVFCVDDVNNILSKDLTVSQGSYIFVYPYVIYDGYVHEDIEQGGVKSLEINSDEGKMKFTMKEYIYDPLFGKVSGLNDYFLVVNKEDFDLINTKCKEDFFIHSTLNLYNIKDWKSSENIVKEIEKRSFAKNNVKGNERLYRVSSKIKSYTNGLKSSNFAIFEFAYISVFLYFASIVMINFKLKMEYEEEEKKYLSLYRIGIINSEIKEMIYKKIFILFFVPSIYSTIMTIIYARYCVNEYKTAGSVLSIIAAIIFYILNYAIYRMYSSRYYKDFISKTKFLENN